MIDWELFFTIFLIGLLVAIVYLFFDNARADAGKSHVFKRDPHGGKKAAAWIIGLPLLTLAKTIKKSGQNKRR